MKVRHFHVRPAIPAELQPLEELARNLWYSWNWDAVQLFIRLNPALWERSYQNPVLMLGLLSQEDLEAAARDESFVANLNRVYRTFTDYIHAPSWFQERHAAAKGFQAAYFSCEFGIDEGLPIYSGGLGILSGDHLKSASDLGLPLVGVGLLYQKGYFRQVLSLDGWQQELYPDNDWYNMPVTLMHGEDGRQITIEIELAGEPVTARIWRVMVGRTPLYLLDTNMKGNSARAREITSTLYGGDREQRLRQEMVLGMGGVKALKALGLSPTVYHMNEGHSALLILERMRMLMADKGLSLEAARELVFSTNVFTTHTPVPAGNEVFDPDLLRKYLQPTADALGVGWNDFLALGQGCQEPGQQPLFGMTVFALRNAAFSNGVSALHGEVSRRMWKALWPTLPESEVPIGSVTNGIHTLSWLSHEMEDLYLRYLGPRFIEKPADHKVWERVSTIPDSEMWRTHQSRKERLVFFVRKRLKKQLVRQGAGASAQQAAEEVLNPQALTIGFSRRFATYKRAGLLFRQPERLVKLLSAADRPVQIVFAGKAHPQDLPAKEIIRSVVHFASDPRVRHQMVFIEDYDINVARYLVQGVDVWLNTPRRPLEASGTSGMKAAANGALNVSVLDGWWCEGYDLDTGWSIGGTEEYRDVEEQDQVESEALFNLLEREIVPLFYKRDRSDLPREWISMMKGAASKLGAVFNTNRMVEEYTERFYLSAHAAGNTLSENGLEGAKGLADWRKRVAASWGSVSVRTAERRKDKEILVGNAMELTVRASLGDLAPEDVAIEIWYGPMDANGEIPQGRIARAVHEGKEGDEDLFRADLPT
ncbi:MAG TPA: alpha-glucan family phosphorylase, partial [Candidatus Deferrimicrobiaceae bacterium]